jgi:hypothetical protein
MKRSVCLKTLCFAIFCVYTFVCHAHAASYIPGRMFCVQLISLVHGGWNMSYKIVQKREIPSNLQKHHSVPTKETLYPNSNRIRKQQNSKFSTSPIIKANIWSYWRTNATHLTTSRPQNYLNNICPSPIWSSKYMFSKRRLHQNFARTPRLPNLYSIYYSFTILRDFR